MPDGVDPQKFGELTATVNFLSRNMEDLTTTVQHLNMSIAALNKQLDEAKGGWKMLATVATVIATLGGAIGWAIGHIRYEP